MRFPALYLKAVLLASLLVPAACLPVSSTGPDPLRHHPDEMAESFWGRLLESSNPETTSGMPGPAPITTADPLDLEGSNAPVSRPQTAAMTLAAAAPATTHGFQAGVEKFFSALKPEAGVTVPPDPLRLDSPATASPGLHTALARLAEQRGNTLQAEAYYRKALELDPRNVDALVGYAHLADRQGRLERASQLYQRAAEAAPNNPAVHNDLGLCLARRKRWDQSLAALQKAIQLDPKNPLYRNNISAVLVERGDLAGAYGHLAAVHGQAVANYNLGYMLQKKGDRQAAIRYFCRALQADPSLDSARKWLEHLASQPAPKPPNRAQIAGQPARTPQPPAGHPSGYARQSAAPRFARQVPGPKELQRPAPNTPPAGGQRPDHPTPRSIPLPPSPPNPRPPLEIQIAPMPSDVYPLPPVN